MSKDWRLDRLRKQRRNAYQFSFCDEHIDEFMGEGGKPPGCPYCQLSTARDEIRQWQGVGNYLIRLLDEEGDGVVMVPRGIEEKVRWLMGTPVSDRRDTPQGVTAENTPQGRTICYVHEWLDEGPCSGCAAAVDSQPSRDALLDVVANVIGWANAWEDKIPDDAFDRLFEIVGPGPLRRAFDDTAARRQE